MKSRSTNRNLSSVYTNRNYSRQDEVDVIVCRSLSDKFRIRFDLEQWRNVRDFLSQSFVVQDNPLSTQSGD